MMLVSVVLPVFNEEPDFLKLSIESILKQTYDKIELIIIDDSTTSVCDDILQKHFYHDRRIQHVKTEARLGLTGSLNFGCSLAKGDYIARMDSDDIALANRIEKQVFILETDKSISVVGSDIILIDNYGDVVGNRRYPTENRKIIKMMHFVNPIAHPTVMFRKEIFESLGGYDEDFTNAEDLELWLRWSNKKVVFSNIPECLLKYRTSTDQRHNSHWLFNLKARIKNLSRKAILLRIGGLLIISLWMVLPSKIKKLTYARLTQAT